MNNELTCNFITIIDNLHINELTRHAKYIGSIFCVDKKMGKQPVQLAGNIRVPVS